jgi:hypothetical protein
MVRRTGDKPGTLCLHCGQWFYFKRYGEGHKWHYNRKQRLCSVECAKLFQTKGWGTDKHGYQVQYRSDGNGKRVWAMQHRKIMEEYLGRPLRREETVHHVNGDRSDNRIENLELWSSRHGKGQRVEDKTEFCRSFLQDYQVDAPCFSFSDAVRGVSGLI